MKVEGLLAVLDSEVLGDGVGDRRGCEEWEIGTLDGCVVGLPYCLAFRRPLCICKRSCASDTLDPNPAEI